MTSEDWPAVRAIYQQGIATGAATFETATPDWAEWNAAHLPYARIVACYENQVSGWGALSLASRRVVYQGVAEVSVYVESNWRGRGVGRLLLEGLIRESEMNSIWTLQAGIFPENVASVRLHLACGFREVGRRERIGRLHGLWRDTLLLERRSSTIGVA